jgi:hypothetical protein
LVSSLTNPGFLSELFDIPGGTGGPAAARVFGALGASSSLSLSLSLSMSPDDDGGATG